MSTISEIEEAIRQLLGEDLAYKPPFINAATGEERFLVIDNLVKSRSHDQEFRELLASRIKALEALPKNSDERRSLEGFYFLRDRLKK